LTPGGRRQAGHDFLGVNIRVNRSGLVLERRHAMRLIRQRNFNLLEE
jgi:hypothetical protein